MSYHPHSISEIRWNFGTRRNLLKKFEEDLFWFKIFGLGKLWGDLEGKLFNSKWQDGYCETSLEMSPQDNDFSFK